MSVLLADLQVLPSPPGNAKHKWKHVDAAIKVIAAARRRASSAGLGLCMFPNANHKEANLFVRSAHCVTSPLQVGCFGCVLARK